MSEADKIFTRIGYIKKLEEIENGNLIRVSYNKENKYSIIFKISTKEIFLDGFRAIEIEELQAINEKVKELGWNE